MYLALKMVCPNCPTEFWVAFRPLDSTNPLPPGVVEALALPGEDPNELRGAICPGCQTQFEIPMDDLEKTDAPWKAPDPPPSWMAESEEAPFARPIEIERLDPRSPEDLFQHTTTSDEEDDHDEPLGS